MEMPPSPVSRNFAEHCVEDVTIEKFDGLIFSDRRRKYSSPCPPKPGQGEQLRFDDDEQPTGGEKRTDLVSGSFTMRDLALLGTTCPMPSNSFPREVPSKPSR